MTDLTNKFLPFPKQPEPRWPEPEVRLDCGLVCPCGDKSEYLHQSKVIIVDQATVEVRCSGKEIKHSGHVDKVYHQYDRGVVFIEFWCEHCDRLPRLSIANHEGHTLMAWDPVSVTRRKLRPGNID